MPPTLVPAMADDGGARRRNLGCVAGFFQALSRHRLHPAPRLTAPPPAPASDGSGFSSSSSASSSSSSSSGESTRPTGLVAKLMGLDAMPAIAQEKGLRRAAPARLPVEIAPWKRRPAHVAPPPPPDPPPQIRSPTIKSTVLPRRPIDKKREKKKPRPPPPPPPVKQRRKTEDLSLDQPSPVSVLRAPFQNEDQPSSPFQAGEVELQKKVESADRLLRKLTEIGFDEAVDHVAFICGGASPEHRYVAEVLLASGLLVDMAVAGPATPAAVQLRRSSPVRPDLFFILERTRFARRPDPVCRRLLFDAVNEVLRRKMDSPPTWMITAICCGDEPPGRKLTREICDEIDGFTAATGGGVEEILRKEAERRWGWWVGAGDEMDQTVLDLERFIFKNLIDEILAGDSFSCRREGHRRRLFNQ